MFTNQHRSRPSKPACLTCKDLKLECCGGQPCRRCVILAHDCIPIEAPESPDRPRQVNGSPRLNRRRTIEKNDTAGDRFNESGDQSHSRIILPARSANGTGRNSENTESTNSTMVNGNEQQRPSKQGQTPKPAGKRGRYVPTGAW